MTPRRPSRVGITIDEAVAVTAGQGAAARRALKPEAFQALAGRYAARVCCARLRESSGRISVIASCKRQTPRSEMGRGVRMVQQPLGLRSSWQSEFRRPRAAMQEAARVTEKDRLGRVATSAPVNQTAARVLSKGTHWEPGLPVGGARIWQDTPLPVLPRPTRGNPDLLKDGFRVCRLTVIGYGGSSDSRGARWVVRCDCGSYGYQRSKFLRSENARTFGMCPRCQYVQDLKTGRRYWEKPRAEGGA
jgi:hypothetical protein